MYKYMGNSDHYVFSTLIIIKLGKYILVTEDWYKLIWEFSEWIYTDLFAVFSTYFVLHGIVREQPFQIIMQLLTLLSLFSLDLIYYLSDISNPPDNSDLDQVGLELVMMINATRYWWLNK